MEEIRKYSSEEEFVASCIQGLRLDMGIVLSRKEISLLESLSAGVCKIVTDRIYNCIFEKCQCQNTDNSKCTVNEWFALRTDFGNLVNEVKAEQKGKGFKIEY